MKVNLCTEPSLVDGWCLRIRTRKHHHFIWPEGWRLRYMKVKDIFS